MDMPELRKPVFRGLNLLWGSGYPELDLSPFTLTRCASGFAVAIDGDGRGHAVEIKDGKAMRLIPLAVATACDVSRTKGRLTLGKQFLVMESAIPLKN